MYTVELNQGHEQASQFLLGALKKYPIEFDDFRVILAADGIANPPAVSSSEDVIGEYLKQCEEAKVRPYTRRPWVYQYTGDIDYGTPEKLGEIPVLPEVRRLPKHLKEKTYAAIFKGGRDHLVSYELEYRLGYPWGATRFFLDHLESMRYLKQGYRILEGEWGDFGLASMMKYHETKNGGMFNIELGDNPTDVLDDVLEEMPALERWIDDVIVPVTASVH